MRVRQGTRDFIGRSCGRQIDRSIERFGVRVSEGKIGAMAGAAGALCAAATSSCATTVRLGATASARLVSSSSAAASFAPQHYFGGLRQSSSLHASGPARLRVANVEGSSRSFTSGKILS